MNMKTCRVCNRNLDDTLFPKNGNALRNICKECQTKRVRAKQLEFVNWLQSLKTECSICGYRRCKEALEWHHTGGDKEFNVSKFVNSNYPSSKNKEKVLTELSKCILVCANCHREIHKNVGLE